ncbi:MAG: DUF3795 domain-containing protein [Acetatifactor sp.]|nr:DUF3795 domain-containing protein [Acetatifactor sp.]
MNKKQRIDFTTITACGECCTDCSKRVNGICRGCIEADGYVPEWAGSGRCKVHECAREHNVQFCGICDAFPCEHLTSTIHWNPNIVDHLNALAEQYHQQKEQADSFE